MRNPTLHGMLEQFTAEAGRRLNLAASAEEIPFDVVQTGDRVPLYCYRPLTGEFIRARAGLLSALPSHAQAARALQGVGAEAYLQARGEQLLPDSPQGCAAAALNCFIARVYEDRSEFDFDRDRFDAAYAELEHAIYQGRTVTEIVAPLLGLDLDADTDELALGEGLSMLRPEALSACPAELSGPNGPPLLLVFRVGHDQLEGPALSYVRTRFRRILTALRLYERGAYAIGDPGYSRLDGGVWTPVAAGSGGRPRRLTLIARDAEDELRGFCNLISRRLPGADAASSGYGEVAWALARFELGCERDSPLEALTDHLLALRALLEPEGPGSGRLAQRLSVICARADDRLRLAERAAEAIALERAVIAGLAPAPARVEPLIDELAEHLRTILRDVLCGHLDADVRTLADELLAEAADELAVGAAAG